MKLSIEENTLHIKFNPLEMFACHHRYLNVPVDSITNLSTDNPGWQFFQVRAPGMHVPFLLKGGTYHGNNGREFWLKTVGKPCLVIDLADWTFNRIVLGIGDNKLWAERLIQEGDGKS